MILRLSPVLVDYSCQNHLNEIVPFFGSCLYHLYLQMTIYNHRTHTTLRSRRTLETRQNLEDDRIVRLTNLVRNTTIAATEAKNKYEEVDLNSAISIISCLLML